MHIIVPKETFAFEKRVALTPDIAKKFIEMGFSISIEKDAGLEAGYPDQLYENVQVTVEKSKKALFKQEGLVLTVSPLEDSDLKLIKEGSILLGSLKPHSCKNLFTYYQKQKLTTFCLEFIPRITRAQTMDILSSQSNLAGYKAVIDASAKFKRAFPLMMTAAGTIPAAKVLILGAGVAGLQAIATAKRLGAIVSAFDVRSAAKEQVQSLGATFVEVEAQESGDGSGGYAKEMSEEYKKAQMKKLSEVIKNQDIVITTALIPGKKAPLLITKDMVESMKCGSVIVDLASESGCNCELSQHGESINHEGIHILAPGNILSHIASDASQLYARNILAFLKGISSFKEGVLTVNWDDEITKATLLTKDGAIIHPHFTN